MWMGRCDYIKRLIDPEKFEDAMNGLEYEGGHAFLACDGRGRYSAEHWVHSHPSVKPCDLYDDPRFTWNYDGIPVVKEFKAHTRLAVAPRFDLKTYIKTRIGDCVGRGGTIKFRLDEYKGLYNETPPDDWWGYNFLQENDHWWPHREYGWVQLPEKARVELIKLGYCHSTWENRHRPYQLYGKIWSELTNKQRQIWTDVFTYDEDSWNKEIQKEKRDRVRIMRSTNEDKPNTSFDRCEKRDPGAKPVTPWIKKSAEEQKSNKPLRSYVYEALEKPAHKRRLLIIAAVTRDANHVITLWSELECFTDHVDHVIISAPAWAKVYVERVVAMAHKHIPHFINLKVSIETRYFLNNRYDVGLWCDAYNSLNHGKNPGIWDEYGLLNDSIFALRKFSGIFDNLEHQNVHMTSLAYSYTYKWNKGFGPEEFWVESVYRGLDQTGMDIFNEHSCVAEDHPFFCNDDPEMTKACIINNFEHDLAKEYPCDKVQGLYPADSPDLLLPREPWKTTWIKNTRYWRMLVDEMGFPIAKANEPEMMGSWYELRESKMVIVPVPVSFLFLVLIVFVYVYILYIYIHHSSPNKYSSCYLLSSL